MNGCSFPATTPGGEYRVIYLLKPEARAVGTREQGYRLLERSWRRLTPDKSLRWRAFPTPLGPITVEYRKDGITRLALPGKEGGLPAPGGPGPAFLVTLGRELDRYFAGERVAFTVPLALEGLTPFQARVLEECRQIPPGEVRTYGWLAARAGRPGAARAVGQVMARNPVPLLIPCHRVVAAGGGLGGFGGGLALKAWLLANEGRWHSPPGPLQGGSLFS